MRGKRFFGGHVLHICSNVRLMVTIMLLVMKKMRSNADRQNSNTGIGEMQNECFTNWGLNSDQTQDYDT